MRSAFSLRRYSGEFLTFDRLTDSFAARCSCHPGIRKRETTIDAKAPRNPTTLRGGSWEVPYIAAIQEIGMVSFSDFKSVWNCLNRYSLPLN